MQALSPTDNDLFWWYKPYLSFWLWLVTMDQYFGTLIPSNFVLWLLTHLHISINDLIMDDENMSHATCCLDEVESTNKLKASCRFHRWCPSCRFHMRYKSFFWLEGFRMKDLFEINNTIKVSSSWILMRMDPLLRLLSKTWLPFFLLSDKMEMTIMKAGQSSKTIILTTHITWQGLAL